jgi:H2-forming N5,N10-methylenetetrahydromethanopterin dehydrogenase-like enzyme
MIYQWNEQTHAFSKKYGALYEIQRDTKVLMDDVLKAMKEKRPIGGFYYTRSPMMDIDAQKREPKQKLDIKTSLMMTQKMADEFISLVGQRNKQDIIRELIAEWIKREKKNK